MKLTIPQDDLAEFAGETEPCRQSVFGMLRVMARLLAVDKGIGAAIEREAGTIGLSPQTLRRYYDTFRHTRDWRALVNRVRFPSRSEPTLIPADVIELWKTLCERNQRKCKPAFRELVRMWQRGEPRGVEWPATDPMTDLPRGCTYRNLMRHAPTKYERTLARIGRGAASGQLPKVLSTRVGIGIGEMIVCDDQDYDVQVAFVGVNRKITRPSGFNALDFASAAEILQGYKPTVLNADGTKQKLRQVDFEWFLVNLFTTIGYRADTGTTIICEHGTTKAGKNFLERVEMATHGQVKFEMSGVHGEQMAGVFRGQPRGNPRYKAARESWFDLLRNEMAALPGATGKDRAHAPEEIYGREKYVRDLLDAIGERPELADALVLPVLRWPDFVRVTTAIVQRINLRTDHELEGWGDRTANEWRLSLQTPWLGIGEYLALPAPQRGIADAMIAQTPGLWRTRQQAPWEVWEAGRSALTKISGAMVPVLLGPEGGRVKTVTNDHHFVIEDDQIEADEMWFDSALTNGRILPQGLETLVYLNPLQPHELQVCDCEGRWLGTAPRVPRPCKTDTAALQRRYGAVRKIEQQLLGPVARRGAEKARTRMAEAQTNIDALRIPPTPGSRKTPGQLAEENPPDRAALRTRADRAREILAEVEAG